MMISLLAAVDAVTAAIDAVPVVTPSGTSTSTAIGGTSWLTLPGIFTGGTFVSIIYVIFRYGPAWTKQAIDSRAVVRKEEADAVGAMQIRVDAIDARLTTSENRANTLETRLTMALSAYRMVAGELQRISPESSILIHAQALLSAAYAAHSQNMPADLGVHQ